MTIAILPPADGSSSRCENQLARILTRGFAGILRGEDEFRLRAAFGGDRYMSHAQGAAVKAAYTSERNPRARERLLRRVKVSVVALNWNA